MVSTTISYVKSHCGDMLSSECLLYHLFQVVITRQFAVSSHISIKKKGTVSSQILIKNIW